mgnify:CR=1 FL=1|jgi:putative hemolysin
MDPDISSPTLLLLICIALLFSAFFSGMEIAFISANRLKIELDKKQGGFTDRLVASFMNKPRAFIATMLVGNNLAMVAYAVLAGQLFIQIVEQLIVSCQWSSLYWFLPQHHYWPSLLIQTALTTLIVLFAAEFIPKAIFSLNPNKWLRVFATPLQLVIWILYLPATLVSWLSKVFIKLLLKADTTPEEVSFGRVDLDNYLQEAIRNIDQTEELDHEIQILQNALDFKSMKARDCMIPRNEIIAHSIDDDLSELIKTFISTGLSKILIYRDSIDNLIGYIHSSALFNKPDNIKEILIPVAIVPEPMPAAEVLEILIHQKKNMAVILDEFGGTSGILTMEDIVEEIFGEIEDEHDSEDLKEILVSDHEFIFSARHEIDYLNDKYKLDIPTSDEYETLSGLILHECESIPLRNSVIEIGNFRFRINGVRENRIEEVKLSVVKAD